MRSAVPCVQGAVGPVLALLGLVNPTVRAARGTAYQFQRPFVLDDRAGRELFGLAPVPWERMLAEIAAVHAQR
ncbi:hypothetical protein AB0K51_03840 [Kitasatospora sp. NPDC049285]|uniref:hypothetical protein n=1 Tax=Kitasatospora sp. NPDC049285 TaxID=3157096 RepID=UPI00342102C7